MPQALRHALISLRDLLFTVGPFVALAALLLYAAYAILQPNPPRRLVLATGEERSAYAEFGARYAALLQQHGITLELRSTQGSADNLALLRQPGSGVDVAFVLGGTDAAAPDSPGTAAAPRAANSGSDAADGAGAGASDNSVDLVSLGSVFHEPIWLFYREASAQRLLGKPQLESMHQLKGWALDVGMPGSGVPPLMQRLLDANGLAPTDLNLSQRALTPAIVALSEGQIDAVALATAPESLMVQMLLRTPGVRLLDVAQSEAYARRFSFMSAVKLPRGVVDLAQDLPSQDVRLLAPSATLLARPGLHPALVQLLVQAAQQTHGAPGWFANKNEFPNAQTSAWPMHDEARRIYKEGAPWLQRYLPFWLANLADRMWVALLAIVAVLIPLSRVLPPLYEYRIRSRIFRWYGQLRSIEDARGQRPAPELLAELAEIEASVSRVDVPLSYTDELYALRGHIQLVRRQVGAG